MMKRSFALVALSLVLSATTASAQSFFESFETGLSTGTPGLISAVPAPVALASGTWSYQNLGTPIGTVGLFGLTPNPGTFNQAAPDGNFAAAMNFNSVTGANPINSWLMTHQVTITNGDTFSFFTRTVDTPAFPDRLVATFSTNGASTNPADFTNVLTTINNGLTTAGYPNQWTQFSFIISGIGGSGSASGRFGFNYAMPDGGPGGNNSDLIGIDSVSFTTQAVPEPTTLALIGLGLCGSVPAYRRWRASKAAQAKAARVFARN